MSCHAVVIVVVVDVVDVVAVVDVVVFLSAIYITF
jgi:hypothetical protein